jgi:DNA repair protein REV1
MKVVKPDWLVKSAQTGKLLPWQDYLFRPSHRESDKSQRPKLSQSPFRASVSHRTADPHTDVEIRRQRNLRQCTPPHLERMPSPGSITFPLYTTDPVTTEQASRVPGYAAHVSNPNAERVMANPEWRAAHTSVASDFVESYYRNSRLHHLSMWKAELKSLVAEAQERAESNISSTSRGPTVGARIGDSNGSSGESGCVSMRGAELNMKSPTKGKGRTTADEYGRVIMHCDFDCFFVSAGLVSRPHLRGKPVVVCHSQGGQGGQASTSEIASCSYEARKFGIKNGMRLACFPSFLVELKLISYVAFSKLVNCVPPS